MVFVHEQSWNCNFKWSIFCMMACSTYVITPISELFRTVLNYTELFSLNQIDSLIRSAMETSNIEFQHQGKIPKLCYSTTTPYSIKQKLYLRWSTAWRSIRISIKFLNVYGKLCWKNSNKTNNNVYNRFWKFLISTRVATDW